jgi:predicted lipoprotein
VLFLRYERFAYWPEARNATQRALDTLLSSQDPDDLLSENLASNSVAGQGLTALERILFDGDDPVTALTSEGMDAEWRAAVGLALSRNVNGIANEVLTDWVVEGGMRASIAAGNGWNNLFADGAEAARLLLTDLVGAFQLMNDGKLLPVLGDSIDTARPRMAEAWRSGRPQRNLAENLAAVREMTMSFAAFTSEPRRAVLLASLDAAAMAIAAVPDDMGEAAADPARRPLVQAAFDALKIAQAEAADILPEDLGITLGFNALDGD